jgi:predicted PurR-regulated permease PerM
MVLAVGILGLTLVLLRLFAAAGRVIGWIAAAAIVAGLLHPIVEGMARRMPRGAAVALVVVVILSTIGALAYNVVDEVTAEARRLERAAPAAARDLERSERFGEAARDFNLQHRTRQFVNDVPERLRGGSAQAALRSAASRGVAFLATGVLSLFFLIHGPRLTRSAIEQLPDPVRRVRVQQVAAATYVRAWRYMTGRLALSALAGGFAWALAHWAEAPGAVVLGLWAALWDIVPVFGAALGMLPLIGFAAALVGAERAIAVAVTVVLYQLLESMVLQRRLERHSLHLGPFLTVAGALVGLEVYGLGGAIFALVALTSLVALSEELEERRAGPGSAADSP